MATRRAGDGVMTHAPPRVALTTALALLAVTGLALAQPPRNEAPSVVGAWRFETARFGVAADGAGCRMTGTMTIVRGARPDTFACTFTATETCSRGAWTAEQRCTATRVGEKLEIVSEILRVTPANSGYAPDNWSLTIRSADLMVGELRSADIAPVQFRRGPAFVS